MPLKSSKGCHLHFKLNIFLFQSFVFPNSVGLLHCVAQQYKRWCTAAGKPDIWAGSGTVELSVLCLWSRLVQLALEIKGLSERGQWLLEHLEEDESWAVPLVLGCMQTLQCCMLLF